MLDAIGTWWATIKGGSHDPGRLREVLRDYLAGLSVARRADVPDEAFRQAGVEK